MKIASYSTFAADVRARGLEYALKRTVALGFEAVELIPSRRDPIPSPEAVREAKKRFAAYGLPVICYSAVADLSTGDPAAVEALKHHAQIAATLGSPYLHHTLFPALSPKADAPTYDEALPRVLDAAAQVADYAATLGLVCLYEPQGLYFNGIEGLGNFFTALKHRCPNVGICADAGNPLFVNADPIAIARHFAPHVRHVHVKNYALSKDEPAAAERYLLTENKWMGATALPEGKVDIPAFLGAFPHYHGFVSLETNGTDEELTAAIAFLRSLRKN